MHQFFHFLGFEKSILQEKKILDTNTNKRINGIEQTKLIAKGRTLLEKAREYFDCSTLKGLEFEKDEEFLHWNKRILLGDIMTSNVYYPDQVISEFTLALLEDIGVYKVNYFTGGLMRFGKHKGCDFIDKDCVELNHRNEISPSFLNEFCFQESTEIYGTCSPGRQSRGYCLQKTVYNDVDNEMRRIFSSSIEWKSNYGPESTEFCPITSEMLKTQVITREETNLRYYIGNCKIGNSNYGDEMEPNALNYGTLSLDFGEILGENSLCGLSSIFTRNISYEGILRPTCYKMFCKEKSLTVQIGDEYIVCPREGGLIKIGKKTADETKYTNYFGYFFCPDYNLVCTGTKFCNDIFDCIDNESVYKTPTYDYKLNNEDITSQVNFYIKSNTELDQIIPIEGYEKR